MNDQETKRFRSFIYTFYKQNKRDLLWRENIQPYWVFVSEVMLQQTQVSRVEKKFPQFIHRFPDFTSLSKAPFSSVLQIWQGMGYNRRAKYLQQSAKIIINSCNGQIPRDPNELEKLRGIGYATARSISTFIYNLPHVFIETNIRRAYLYHFFYNKIDVSDKKLMPIIQQTLDREDPRQWYYALMDYGAHLKTVLPNANKRSKHYSIQSRFEGSDRQIRGQILKSLLKSGKMKEKLLASHLQVEKERLYPILEKLTKEGFLYEKRGVYTINTNA